MGEDYFGRIVYSLDGFQRGTIIDTDLTRNGQIISVKVKLDKPIYDKNHQPQYIVEWFWTECKLA